MPRSFCRQSLSWRLEMWYPTRVMLCLAGILTAGAAAGRIELRIPADIVFDRTVGADGAVVFRHSTHAGFTDLKCGTCHPAPFKMLRPSRETSHELMNNAQSCGVCHDGRRAFSTKQEDLCARCHTAWRKAQSEYPADVSMRNSPDSPGAVLFRHSSHRGPGVSCGECHIPAFRQRTAGAAAPSPPGPHQTCGACHDGTRAFTLEDDAGCPRCHAMKETAR
jgi:c(7)-type cytochrome triheme protein